jgi:hypothetical protein
LTPVEFLRDYLSKWGPEMDPDEHDGIRRSIEALEGISAAVAAEREACAVLMDELAALVENSLDRQKDITYAFGFFTAANRGATKIRARGSQ